MSLLSSRVGIVARAAPPGPAPIDDLYAKWTLAAAVFFVSLEIAYLVLGGLPPIGKPWVDGTHFVIGRDFLNTWMGGRSVFGDGPAAWFDATSLQCGAARHAGHRISGTFLVVPAGRAAVHLAVRADAVSAGLYRLVRDRDCALSVRLLRRHPARHMLFLAVAPGVAVCIFFGQNGFYTAALLIGGLLCLDRRPVLAGVLFGILTVKPQIGILLPVMLLLERRWITIASATATVVALVAATAMLFGWDVWVQFWQKVVPQQQWLTAHGGGLLLVMVSSVFYGARLLHLPTAVGWTLQGMAAALALAAVIWCYWRRRDPALSLALFVTATFLVTPYILNYDMVVLGFVVASLRDRADNTTADHRLLIAVWSLPVTMMLAAVGSIPLAPVVLIAFASRLVWRIAHGDARGVRPLPQQAAAASA